MTGCFSFYAFFFFFLLAHIQTGFWSLAVLRGLAAVATDTSLFVFPLVASASLKPVRLSKEWEWCTTRACHSRPAESFACG